MVLDNPRPPGTEKKIHLQKVVLAGRERQREYVKVHVCVMSDRLLLKHAQKCYKRIARYFLSHCVSPRVPELAKHTENEPQG